MKLIKSLAFAWAGLKTCFVSEANFKIHLLFAVVVIFLGFVFNVSNTEWLEIIFCIAFVIVMEMINTAIEKLCDVVHKELHPGIKKVKDITAGAVLIAAVSSLIIGILIFLPKIILFIKSY